MAVRECAVSFENADGVTYRVTVQAESLFEAVALAVAAFRQQPFVPPIPPMAPLRVEVRVPTVTHAVTLQATRQWVARPATSPADKLHRDRLRRLLATS